MADEADRSPGILWRLGLTILAVLILSSIGIGLTHWLARDVGNEQIIDASLSVSQVGGLVSGFTLTATAILSLGGQYRELVLKPYGSLVRFLLMANYSVVTLTALFCALTPLWKEWKWNIYVLGASVALIVGSMLITLCLFNGAYSWGQEGETKRSKKPGPNV